MVVVDEERPYVPSQCSSLPTASHPKTTSHWLFSAFPDTSVSVSALLRLPASVQSVVVPPLLVTLPRSGRSFPARHTGLATSWRARIISRNRRKRNTRRERDRQPWQWRLRPHRRSAGPLRCHQSIHTHRVVWGDLVGRPSQSRCLKDGGRVVGCEEGSGLRGG